MQKTFESALDSEGRPIANASVTVLNYPAGTIATIYSDNGISQKINPFLTNANGLYEFYADNGRYSIIISGTNLVPVQIDDISISDIAAANSVTNAKLAIAPAHTFKGNNTNAAANVQDLSATQLTAELIAFVGDTGAGGTKGLVPAPIAGDAAKYLRADGSWQVVVGGGTSNAAHEYVIATGGSLNYLLTPVQAITAYALNQSQIYEVQWNADCVDNPTAAISGLAAKNIVVLSGDGTYANAAARDIVTGSISTLETIDGGGGVLKLWLKDPAVLHSNLSSVSTNTAFTVATAYGRVIKSTGTAARQHTLPVFSTWPLEGVFELIAENTSMQIARQSAGDVIDFYGVNLATDGVTGAFIDVPSGTQLKFIKTVTAWQITSTRANGNTAVVVRQAIQNGALTAAGQPDLITQAQVGATLATGVVTNGTFYASVGNGFTADGLQRNLNRVRTTALTYAGLAASVTNYLWYDTVADTSGMVSVADVFQAGGTIAVTTNQYTYDYLNHIMYLGNGTTATQSNRIIIAEVDTSATVVTAIRVRAYAGQYDSGYTNILVAAGAAYARNHNMGTQEITVTETLQNITADIGYVTGDTIDNPLGSNATYAYQPALVKLKNTISMRKPSGNSYNVANATTGVATGLTAASWKYKITANRNF